MFRLLKFIIWLVGITVIIYFTLPFFGYELNRNYLNASKISCQQRLDECTKNILRQGVANAKCDIICTNQEIIIKKQ